jgi:hypothetical protein
MIDYPENAGSSVAMSRAVYRSAIVLTSAVSVLLTAEAQAWVVRPAKVADTNSGTATLPHNVDVMVSPVGGVRLGYALPNGGTGTGYLSTLDGQGWLHDALPTPTRQTSFQMDAYGAVTWASREGSYVSIGEDLGAFGGIVESLHPSNLSISPTLTLDNNGRPAIVSYIESQRVLSRYDIQQGVWVDQAVPAYGPSTPPAGGYTSFHSLAFTPDNRAVVGYYEAITGPLFVVVEDPALGTVNIAGVAEGMSGFSNSIAIAPTGEVAFAFVDMNHEMVVGIYNGIATTFETVATEGGFLTPRSLAYDPVAGQFALAYAPDASLNPGDAQPLHVARRTGTDTWSDEILPIHAIHASLTFDEAGSAYIGAVTTDYITLITDAPAVPSALAGDRDLDGFVGIEDLNLILRDWNVTVPPGSLPDPSYDGFVGIDDLNIVLGNWNAGTPPPPGVQSKVPEPGSLVLLAAGMGLLLRRGD